MTNQLSFIIQQLNDAYNGDPWFGRSVNALLGDVEETAAFRQPAGQHSILQLVWHMVNWREFVINSLRPQKPTGFYDENDWQELNHQDKKLWSKGLQRLDETQQELIVLLKQRDDTILIDTVPGRKYNFQYLLFGLVQHDIYHAGQIAYISKLLH